MPARWLLVALVACGRDKGVPDDRLGGLVVEPRPPAAIDIDQAVKDPAELSRALALPYTTVVAALGPHAVTVDTRTVVEEGDKAVEDLSDRAVLELGANGAFHGLYTNSADYGREAVFDPQSGRLYLRPRYQKWNGRAPEHADEPTQVRDGYAAGIAATWELVAPGAELTDKGPTQVAGRAGRKIAVKLAPAPRDNPRESVSQRRWRESRKVMALDGEITLDADKGVPLAAKLTGAIRFTRDDGRQFTMKLGLEAAVTKLGVTEIAAPPEGEVIAAPSRRPEVDERDFLLHGIAPPIHKNADGTAREPKTGGQKKP